MIALLSMVLYATWRKGVLQYTLRLKMPDPSPDVILIFWFCAVAYVVAVTVIGSLVDRFRKQ
jgi:hypothetical protein